MTTPTLTLEQVTFWALLKNMSYLAVFVSSIEWLGFNPLSLGIFAVLMLIDVITGVMRSMATSGGSSFTSETLHRGLLRKIMLVLALFSLALTSKAMGYDFDIFAQSALNVFTVGELYSILGNVHSARTGKPKREFDAVSYLLERVERVISNLLKK